MEKIQNKEIIKQYEIKDILNELKSLKEDNLFQAGLFLEGYYIDDVGNLYKVYLVKNDIDKWIKKENNPVVLWKYIALFIALNKIDNLKLQPMNLKELSVDEIIKIKDRAMSLGIRLAISFRDVKDLKNIENKSKFFEKLYNDGLLAFLDILKFYVNGLINKKEFKMFMDKVIREEYLSRQLGDIRFYRLFQNLNADKKSAKEFLENIKGKSLKEIINDPTYWNPEGLFNLYVWMVILKTLKEKGVISEEDYRRYEKTIVEMIKRIEEDKEVVRRLEEEEQKEKDENIDKYRQELNDFLDKMRR